MVAVMLVVLSHLFDWPRGGFIGVDVFFVISGFLITGSLLHTFEKTGKISFSSFYRRRIRRIVPAATLVLVATCAFAYVILSNSSFTATLIDALWAFLFVANWRFAIEGTDYFTNSASVSPLQHYWSLSVEEQFYFVWPAVILAIGMVVSRQSWPARTRLALSASVMGLVVASSFIYAVLDTAGSPTWAYFSTLTRVWELGVGALLAISISFFERIPNVMRPVLAWTGLALIAVGAFVISETGGGFPAPWGAVPVLGAALVIVAGVAGDREYLQVLTNRVSTYIGDISYSLYLWHWPVIILLAVLMDKTVYYYAAALFLMFGFSIAAYHFFENPIRGSKWLENATERNERRILDMSRWRLRTLRISNKNQIVGIAALAMVTAGLSAYALQPLVPATAPPIVTALSNPASIAAVAAGPAQQQLSEAIAASVQATSWPELNPSMDDAIRGKQAPADILPCGTVSRPSDSQCTWGNPGAPHTMMVLGDSVAMTYIEPLRKFAEASEGRWKVRSQAMFGCNFVDITTRDTNDDIGKACPEWKSDAIRAVNELRPDIVFITNAYVNKKALNSDTPISPNEWTAGMTRLVSQFAENAGKVVFLAAPPSDVNIRDCYNRVNTPADCLSRVTGEWNERADIDEALAKNFDGIFVDTRTLFCTEDGFCPSFVGHTPVKSDVAHMTPEYASLISPALVEVLKASGVVEPQ